MSSITMTSPPVVDVLTEKPRISSIDMLRGIVMVIMALDHSRDFYHLGALTSDPTNMQTTTPVLFFTRWITHFCAPAFVFLAGTSIHISAQRKSKKDLSMFLLTRGLWLIVLEAVVVRFGLFFNFYYDLTVFQVIWAIGAAMVCMAALIHLTDNWILGIGLFITFGHNATDGLRLETGDPMFPIWAMLRQTGFMSLSADSNLMVMYPLLPWLGIMMLGYALGRLYRKDFDPRKRQKLLITWGLATIGLFVLIRATNLYGD
ncbi:MAG TPA: heparan-alpha-glucosaminide N-acetyltransferase domain-containing protein, partial [Chryseosolibacter sp.]|nr:heparan-alpha-glucosaminide N-acetyltransferase domain-containing protein [Chryseosolibacter sp.]